MKKIMDGVALLKSFSLYELSGTVLKETTRSETHISGTIGTSDTIAHGLAPYMPRAVKGKIKSETDQYQTIHLSDSEGRRQVVELVNFVVPCAEGDELTFWGIKEDKWFAAQNRNTGRTYKKPLNARRYLYPRREHLVLTALLALPMWLDMKTANDDPGFSIFAGLICLAIAGILVWGPMAALSFIRGIMVMRKVPYDTAG